MGAKKMAVGGAVKLASLGGLGLEAVRDKHAGWRVWDSWRRCPILQASWCSIKLSTLSPQLINPTTCIYLFMPPKTQYLTKHMVHHF